MKKKILLYLGVLITSLSHAQLDSVALERNHITVRNGEVIMLHAAGYSSVKNLRA